MKTFDNYLKEQLENKEFANEYKNIQPDMDIIRAIVSARASQNLTQKQLSEKTGIDQSDISKQIRKWNQKPKYKSFEKTS